MRNNAAGVVRAHGYGEGLGQIGDLLGFEQTARVSNIELRDIQAPVDDKIRESLAARQVLARQDGHLSKTLARRTQALEKSGGMGSSSHNGLMDSTASASWMAVRKSYSQWQCTMMS